MNNYIISTIILLVLDIIWIQMFMKEKYNKQIYNIQKSKLVPKVNYALVAYILMVVGLNLFVIPHIRKGYELVDSLKYGFIFGIVLYGVYDFTCAAVFNNWDIQLAMIDVLWGGVVYFVSAYIGAKIHNK